MSLRPRRGQAQENPSRLVHTVEAEALVKGRTTSDIENFGQSTDSLCFHIENNPSLDIEL